MELMLEAVFNFDGVDYYGNNGLIESQLVMLNMFKNDGRVPAQKLLDDISAYEWMLADVKRVTRYFATKRDNNLLRPRDFWKVNK